MTGEQLFEHYQKLGTNYSSIVKMLPYGTGSFERTFQILERCQLESKKLFAYYPGINCFPSDEIDNNDSVEAIGPIMDGFMYLAPTDWIHKMNLKYQRHGI